MARDMDSTSRLPRLLFIASLAYLDPILYEEAVLGIFVASVVSALLGIAWLRAVLPAR